MTKLKLFQSVSHTSLFQDKVNIFQHIAAKVNEAVDDANIDISKEEALDNIMKVKKKYLTITFSLKKILISFHGYIEINFTWF